MYFDGPVRSKKVFSESSYQIVTHLDVVVEVLEVVTGASVHAPIQRNSTYAHNVRWSVYETRWTEHPHFTTLWYQQLPQETTFLDPLHGILPRHGPTLQYRYRYIYVYVYSPGNSAAAAITTITPPQYEPANW